MDDEPMELTDILEILQTAFNQLATIHGRADRCSRDTAFAIGEALGTIGKAKALVGRDVDDEQRRSVPDQPTV